MFGRVVHCDWSLHARGRWMAAARRGLDGAWHASGPESVPDPAALARDLAASADAVPTLAAFDFPIGFPAGFGARTGFGDFPAALDAIGRGEWPDLFAVASVPGEIGVRRPFYPARPGGTRLGHLLDGHGVGSVAELVRACERAGPDSGPAGCMFWTLGAKQVGKAALLGWRDVIVPARRAGARLWPFDGAFAALAGQGGLVLAESYPADAYGQIGVAVRSKRDRGLRASLAPRLLDWAAARDIRPDAGLAATMLSGFPPGTGGDDGFDAVLGLLAAAVAVARGERPAGPPETQAMLRWEGWILGKRPGRDDG